MIIVTSVSPTHTHGSNQQPAIDSWNKITDECYSLNRKEEIEILEPLYNNITFIETDKTIGHLVGKNLVTIYAMIDFAKGRNEDLLLVNSDIIISHLPEFKIDGITLFSRYDYNSIFEEASVFNNGFDAFFIPKKLLNIFPFSIYAMGGTWWDYSLPFTAHKNKIPTYYPIGKFTFHKIHAVHYPFQDYLDIGEFFRWNFKLDKRLTIPQIAAISLETIKQKLIKY